MSLFLAQVPGAASFAPLGLVLFLTVFTAAVIWVFRKDSRALYEKAERLPLEGD